MPKGVPTLDEILNTKAVYKAPYVPKATLPKATIPKKTTTPTLADISAYATQAQNLSGVLGKAYAATLPTAEKTKIATETAKAMASAPSQYGFFEAVSPVSPMKQLGSTLGQKIDTEATKKTLPYKIGAGVGMAAQFAVPYAAAGKSVSTAIKAAPTVAKLGKVGQAVAGSVGTDLAIGLPLNVAYAAKEGLQGKEAAKSIGVNTAIDLVTGGLLEAVPIILKSGKKIASKTEFENATPEEKTEVLKNVDFYVSPTGQTGTQKTTLALPSPKTNKENEIAKIVNDFTTWRKKNFGGAFGTVNEGDTQALKDLYREDTGINIDSEINRINAIGGETTRIPRYNAENLPAEQTLPQTQTTIPTAKTEAQTGDFTEAITPTEKQELKTENPKATTPIEKSVQTPDEQLADVLTSTDSEKKKLSETITDTTDYLYRKLVDAGNTVSKIAKITGDKHLYAYYNNARIARSRADQAIGEAQTDINGDVVGKSLNDIFDPIRAKGDGYYKDFGKYMYNLHNVDRMAQNKPVFGASKSAQASIEEANALLKQYPEFAQYAKDVYNYNKNLMQYRIDGNLVSKEQADIMNNMYQHYVPIIRSGKKKTQEAAFDVDNIEAVSQTVKSATGGNEDILPLHVAMARQTMNTVDAASKNLFGNRLLRNANQDTAKYLQDLKATDEAFDIDADELPELKNVFKIYRNGKAYTMNVDNSLFEGIQAISKSNKDVNPIENLVTGGNTLYKQLITSYNPMFLVKNGAKDIQDVGLYSKDLNEFTKQYPNAIKEMTTNGKLWQKYKALGGAGNSFFDYAKGYKNNPSWLKKNTIDRIEQINMSVEQLPRFTEFLATLAKGDGSYDNLMEAMYNAADVTVNFGRSGTWGKTLNSTFVPFFNPAMQGADKIIRKFTQTKGAKEWTELILKIASLGVAPSLINEMVYSNDPDYEILNDREKDLNFLFKIGDGEFIKIPKGRVLSLFGSGAQRTLRAAQGKEDAFAGYLTNMEGQVAPISPFESNIASPLIGAASNETWYKTPIVPQRLEKKYSSGKQVDESTSIIAEKLGAALNYSPKKIDYILDSYSGVIGDFVLPLTTPKAEQNPIKKAFILDSTLSNKLGEQFYDKIKTVTEAKNDEEGIDENDVLVRYLNKQSGMVSDLYKEIRSVEGSLFTDKTKKEKVKELRSLINGIEQNALDTLPEIEKVTKELQQTYTDTDDLTREVNREVFGSEYALKAYNKDVYEKAKKSGVDMNDYYTAYFAQKDYSTNLGKALSLLGTGTEYVGYSFGLKDNTYNMASAVEAAGIKEDYINMAEILSGISGSENKKAVIDSTLPELTREQRVLLYEAFDISQGVGNYSRQFK